MKGVKKLQRGIVRGGLHLVLGSSGYSSEARHGRHGGREKGRAGRRQRLSVSCPRSKGVWAATLEEEKKKSLGQEMLSDQIDQRVCLLILSFLIYKKSL
jgi:hypothetical protein